MQESVGYSIMRPRLATRCVIRTTRARSPAACAPGEEEHGWAVTRIAAERDGSILLRVVPMREAVECPECGTLSRRRHSWYTRRALDLPWGGATARLRIRSRRWFCDQPGSRRKIFAERFDGVLARCARRTNGGTEPGRDRLTCRWRGWRTPGKEGRRSDQPRYVAPPHQGTWHREVRPAARVRH